MTQSSELSEAFTQVGADVKGLRAEVARIPEKLDKSEVSTQGAALIKATTPSSARGYIGAAAPPALLPAGTTAVPIDTPVGLVLWRA